MEELLVEAYDLIPLVTEELKEALRKAQVDQALIDGVDSLISLQAIAIRSYHLKSKNAGPLLKVMKECKAFLSKLEEGTDKPEQG